MKMLIVVGILHCIIFQLTSGHSDKEKNPVLLISLDGFRWNYLNKTRTPTFDGIIKRGVHAVQGIQSVFVANTIPNHWSMVTGLYPESNGVINNYFYDPVLKEKFIPKYFDPLHYNNPKFYDAGGEPIWVTNQLQGGKSGSVMWYGAENPVKWVSPTFHWPINLEIKPKVKIDAIVSWFTSERPINLGLLYIDEPDSTGHRYGPDSQNMTNMIQELDQHISYLLQELKRKDILDDINIIITADHGFTTLSSDKVIVLDKIVDPSWYETINENPVASIVPAEGKEEIVYELFKKAANKVNSHFKAYRKSEIPDFFHYKNNVRVTPIILIADLHWWFVHNITEGIGILGSHGFDNHLQDMHPIFMAMGPGFKSGHSVETFSIVDIYPLICKLLGLHPAPNNGSLKTVGQLLAARHEEKENTFWTLITYIGGVILIATVAGVFSVGACRQRRYLQRKKNQHWFKPIESVKYSRVLQDKFETPLDSDNDETFIDAYGVESETK